MNDLFPLVTAKRGTALIEEQLGFRVPISRFYKDTMKGVAPTPVATYGRVNLFTPAQILQYGRSLVRTAEKSTPQYATAQRDDRQEEEDVTRPTLPRKTGSRHVRRR